MIKMKYYDYMKHACDETIVQAENGLYYVEPAFRVILDLAGLNPANIEDYDVTWRGVQEYLDLQVKKLNTINDKAPAVYDWLHKIVTTTIEPSMLAEETEMTQNLVEYMRLKSTGEA